MHSSALKTISFFFFKHSNSERERDGFIFSTPTSLAFSFSPIRSNKATVTVLHSKSLLCGVYSILPLLPLPLYSMDDSDSVWDSSDQEEVTYERTMAEKEWNRLHQNHGNEGYKEGIIEGKEVWMQRGFDSGYEEGLAVGKALGHLRGRVSTYVLFYTVMLEQPVTALQELLEELSQMP
ncbi:hypothetical protein BDF14DRAFT_1862107 [Spinellus fusiger]|nr:hypothetical protein BDF14DRAFT_1862107 [Spinellus fusiger]